MIFEITDKATKNRLPVTIPQIPEPEKVLWPAG